MEQPNKNATAPRQESGGARQLPVTPNYTRARPRLDFAAINAAALGSLPVLLERWLPDGKRRGAEWVAYNPKRNDNGLGSFSVNMNTGRWADFATGDKGGDPVSLAAFLFDLRQSEAAREIAQMLGVSHG